MPDPHDDWPLPKYNAGPRDHLHAFGVISTMFNGFEDGIFRLYRHHLDLIKVPYTLSEFFYLSLNENMRIEALKRVFEHCEKDVAVRERVFNLVEYFQWCWDCRNKLSHSEHYPASFGGRKGFWHLTKRISKRNPDRGYMQIDLATLRKIADKTQEGIKHCATLQIYLRVRDIPLSQLPRSYLEFKHEPLPGTLEIPDSLELSPSPQN